MVESSRKESTPNINITHKGLPVVFSYDNLPDECYVIDKIDFNKKTVSFKKVIKVHTFKC